MLSNSQTEGSLVLQEELQLHDGASSHTEHLIFCYICDLVS